MTPKGIVGQTKRMKVLVTGGAGYIGSTICAALYDSGITPIILDVLLTGREEFTKNYKFYYGDIQSKDIVNKIFDENPDIYAIIHCAARVVVSESVKYPYWYYKENVSKTLEFIHNVLEIKKNCRFIFSSSASIYDNSPTHMVTEVSPLAPKSPYAATKAMVERILEDICHSANIKAIALRYFNPIGADPLMRSGPHIDDPTHLMGKLLASLRDNTPFKIFGGDWPTRDGSAIRDYIHVWDLAMAHVQAIYHFDSIVDTYKPINIGTGSGVTVKEFVSEFEKVTKHKIEVQVVERRDGDVVGAYANNNLAKDLLGWHPSLTISQGMCDALRWEVIHKPNILSKVKIPYF